VQLRIALKNSLHIFSLEASFFTPMVFGSQEYLQERFKRQDWSPGELGPWALIGSLETLEFLGTHFKTPQGTKNFLTLQNPTE